MRLISFRTRPTAMMPSASWPDRRGSRLRHCSRRARDDGRPPPAVRRAPSRRSGAAADPDRIGRRGPPTRRGRAPRPGPPPRQGRGDRPQLPRPCDRGGRPSRRPRRCLLQVAQLGHRPGRRDPLGPGAHRPRSTTRPSSRVVIGRTRAARVARPTPSTTCSATPASTTSRPATSSSATASGSAASRSTRSARWARCSSPPTRSPTRRRSTSPATSTARIAPAGEHRRHVLRRRGDRQPLLAGVHARAGRRHRDRARRPASASSATRRSCSATATRWSSRSRGSAGSSTSAGSTARRPSS